MVTDPADTPPREMPSIATVLAEAWNSHDPDRVAALFTEDAVYEDLAFQVSWTGRNGVAEWARLTLDSMPDLRLELVEAFQEGDRAAVRWTFHATPRRIGETPGNGAAFTVPLATLLQLAGDRVRRASDHYNLADVLRQSGLPADCWRPPG